MRRIQGLPLGLAMMLTCCTSSSTTSPDAGQDAVVLADARQDSAATADTGPAVERHIAIVIGTLAGTPAATQPVHDAIASGGQASSIAAGDLHHEVFLGTSILGTQMDQFLATDRWTNLEGARAVYSNPDFVAAFSMLFASPTAPALYTASDWHRWGTLDSADASNPRFFAVVRGRLASSNIAALRTTHDAFASAGQTMAMSAGDVAHVVFLGAEDPTQFLAIDVWTSSAAIAAVYSNPDFQAGLAPLFAAPPTIGIYSSTGWHQW